MKKTYYAVITQSKGDNDYGVFFPEVENCFTTGETVEMAIKNASDALELHLDGWIGDYPQQFCFADLNINLDEEDGNVITIVPVSVAVQGRKIRINTTLDEWLLKKVDKVAPNRSQFIEQALNEKLNNI